MWQNNVIEIIISYQYAIFFFRQLLTGVDNLRIMAATLENMHRIEERTEPFLDLDDEAGPAL